MQKQKPELEEQPVPKKESKPKAVTIESKLRKSAAHSWVEDAAANSKAEAIRKKRDEKKSTGRKLSQTEMVEIADQLEEVQRELNPLLQKHEELSAKLVAHWAYTGIEEIKSSLGNTLISTSLSLCIDPDKIKKRMSENQWRAVSIRILQVSALFAIALKDENMQAHIAEALVATKVRVSVTPPSSRRPKSGEQEDE